MATTRHSEVIAKLHRALQNGAEAQHKLEAIRTQLVGPRPENLREATCESPPTPNGELLQLEQAAQFVMDQSNRWHELIDELMTDLSGVKSPQDELVRIQAEASAQHIPGGLGGPSPAR